VIGRVAFGTPGDVAAAVDTAAKAQPGWAALDDQERCAALMRAADAIDAHAEELAYVVSREQGKTMNGLGARYEAAGCAAWVRAAASTPLPVEVLVDDGQSRAGVLTAVTGAGDVGDALVRDPRVGKVMFTGSVKTGMKVIEASAGNMPRLTLELGGNDAAIVLPDVDPQAIAEGLFWGAFINNGQTCAAMKRLYVPDAIYDEVVDALAALAAKIPMGVGLDEGTSSARYRTRCSGTSSTGWSKTPRYAARASSWAATRTPPLPATSTPRP
jgi:acyl-CoA reductase-like NAD-dependent aldehyde dehydrogenase